MLQGPGRGTKIEEIVRPQYIFPWIEYNIKNRIYALAYRVYG